MEMNIQRPSVIVEEQCGSWLKPENPLAVFDGVPHRLIRVTREGDRVLKEYSPLTVAELHEAADTLKRLEDR
jgi:hypothetical protein